LRYGILLTTFLAFVLPAAGAAAPAELETLRAGVVVIRYHATDARAAQQVAETAREALQQMRDKLGIALRPTVEVVLARGTAEFKESAGEAVPEWALGIARTTEGRVVIDMSRTSGFDLSNDLLLTFCHELCHIALGQVEREAHAGFPVWFHEGVAIWLSGYRLGIDRRPFLDAAGAGRLMPLAELRDGFPAKAREAELAYLEAEDFVGFLVEKGGEDPLARIIDAFAAGKSFDDAVAHAVGESLHALEAEWAEALRVRHPFFAMLLRHLSLFGILAVATVLIFFLVRARARRKKKAWEEEERMLQIEDEEEEPEEQKDIEDG